MIGWYTDNEISKTVMKAVNDAGFPIKHIRDFPEEGYPSSIFYGILRGAGNVMHEMRRLGRDFWYIDNGYFDAEYIDRSGRKSLNGTYRIVCGDMIETYIGKQVVAPVKKGKVFLIILPSPYTANFYDTTPEEWADEWARILAKKGYAYKCRNKASTSTLHEDLDEIRRIGAGVLAFNSMAIMSALERNIPVYDTHGLFKNSGEILRPDFQPGVLYDFREVEKFYRPKQFTIEQIAKGRSSLNLSGVAA